MQIAMLAYDAGYDAYLAGSSKIMNPHAHGSDEHFSWDWGYDASEEDNTPDVDDGSFAA